MQKTDVAIHYDEKARNFDAAVGTLANVEGQAMTSDMYQEWVDRSMETMAGYDDATLEAFMDNHAKYGLVGMPDALVDAKVAGMDDEARENFVNALRDMDAAATERYMHDMETNNPEDGLTTEEHQAKVEATNGTWAKMRDYASPEHGNQFVENLYHASEEIDLSKTDLKGWTLLKDESEAVYYAEHREHGEPSYRGEDPFRDKDDIAKRAGMEVADDSTTPDREDPLVRKIAGQERVDRSKDGDKILSRLEGAGGPDFSAGLSI